MTANRPAVVGVGAGGHSAALIEAIRLEGRYEVVGMLDIAAGRAGTAWMGVPVLGDDSLLPDLHHRDITRAFIGIGGAHKTGPRRDAWQRAVDHGLSIIDIRHPSAVWSASAQSGRGLVLLALSVVNANAVLGDNVLVNTGAIVEHDCVLGDHVHVAPGAVVSAGVRIGDGSHVGAGSVIRQSIRIGANAVIGAGAVVVGDVPGDTVVAGVPARALRLGAS